MRIKNIIETGIGGLFTAIEALCRLMLVFMACTVTAQVIARACGGNIRWCEEIMLFLLDGLMFLLLPVGIKEDLHIRVEVFAKRFPKKAKRWLVYFSDVVMLLVSVCMVYYGRVLMTKTFSKLNVTGIPKRFLYLFTVVSGVLCAVVLLAKLFGMFRTQSTTDFLNGTGEGAVRIDETAEDDTKEGNV